MTTPLTTEEYQPLTAVLRPDEEVLWHGRSAAASSPAPSKPAGGFFQRLRALCSTAAPVESEPAQPACLYILTPKRVLQLHAGVVKQEWPLMLGMVQKVETCADGSGSIVFDYAQPTDGDELQACGILHVADVVAVHAKLAAAIDAAYLASPWT